MLADFIHMQNSSYCDTSTQANQKNLTKQVESARQYRKQSYTSLNKKGVSVDNESQLAASSTRKTNTEYVRISGSFKKPELNSVRVELTNQAPDETKGELSQFGIQNDKRSNSLVLSRTDLRKYIVPKNDIKNHR